MARDIDDYGSAGAGELAQALSERRVSAHELFRAAVERIERLDGAINAVVVRDFERAEAAARAADAALARGERAPLLGVPMTVKEAHNVAGLPTTWGIAAAKGWVAPEDSEGVKRLKKAGAVIVGKTNVPPYLGDWQSDNPIYGRTNHPFDPARTPGGSSGGGAAAVASGMVPLEFGSDIGGSIRVPSAFCGIYGHKPSWNLIPDRGHEPPGLTGAPTALGVIGPMARSAADLDLALSILAGPAGDEAKGYRVEMPAPRRASLAGLKVLILDSHPLAKVQGAIRQAIDAVAGKLEAAGAQVSRDRSGLPDLERAFVVYSALLGAVMSRGNEAMTEAMGGPASAHDWLNAIDAQDAIRRQWAALFERVDVVLAPAFGVVAFPHDPAPFNERVHVIDGETTPYPAQVAWASMATLGNLPATAAPVGRTAEGLPIGLQIIGPYLEDRTTIAVAGMIGAL